MRTVQRVIAIVTSTLAATALALPSAPGAAAAAKNRTSTGGGATWTAPWATSPARGACSVTPVECASATVDGDLRAVVGPAAAGIRAYGNTPVTHEQRAAVLLDDVIDKSGTTSRTYTATVVLRDVATSGAGYADLEARLVSAPEGCFGSCTVSGGRVRVAAGDTALGDDVSVTLSFELELGWGSALSALPVGAYTIEVGAIAGIAMQEARFPVPCFTSNCYVSPGSAGVGSADVAATVQKVVR